MGKSFLVLLAILSSFQLTNAEENKCNDLITQINKLDPDVGQGWRGFMSPKPAYTPESNDAAEARFFMYWRQNVYVAKSVEDIIRHDALQNNILIKGMYTIGERPSLEMVKDSLNARKSKAPTPIEIQKLFFNTAYKNGVYWVDYEGIDVTSFEAMQAFAKGVKEGTLDPLKHARLKEVDPQFVIENFPLDKLLLAVDAARGSAPGEPLFSIEGWFAPRYRGILMVDSTDPKKSSTYDKVESTARTLYKRGFRFVFSSNYAEALNILSKQERSEPNLETGNRVVKDPSTNRFLDAAFREKQLEIFNKGLALSGEVLGPDGQLVGGFIGTIKDNRYSPNTVFYNSAYFIPEVKATLTKEENELPTQELKTLIEKRASAKALMTAKISMRMLAEKLSKAKIPFIEAGMVTNFTNTMNAHYIPRAQYEELMKTLPDQKIEVDFSEWVPVFPENPNNKNKKGK
ncbi:MAG: hypothetical protein IPM57_07705 [Oligoflexia bacterium]|nr:hypothetical protein [Oligoflexia bacterium]